MEIQNRSSKLEQQEASGNYKLEAAKQEVETGSRKNGRLVNNALLGQHSPVWALLKVQSDLKLPSQ